MYYNLEWILFQLDQRFESRLDSDMIGSADTDPDWESGYRSTQAKITFSASACVYQVNNVVMGDADQDWIRFQSSSVLDPDWKSGTMFLIQAGQNFYV
jgi:hypothetical protein